MRDFLTPNCRGLDAFEALPNFIWDTGADLDVAPHRYKQVKLGDRWIAFAYTTSDKRERPLSLVTGFYECMREAEPRLIPSAGLPSSEGKKESWMIEGLEFGKQPRRPVGVPPINDVVSPKRVWNNQAIVPIGPEDFAKIRDYVFSHEFNTDTIPLLARQPKNEQEVLSIVVSGHKGLGIERIIQVRKAFPDLLVRIEGHSREVYLELEVYSQGFFNHGHDDQVSKRQFTKDGKPVAVLCWIDNDKRVKDRVHRVYELQSLIRDGRKIVW